jgi:hypothetical protein
VKSDGGWARLNAEMCDNTFETGGVLFKQPFTYLTPIPMAIFSVKIQYFFYLKSHSI